MAQQELTSPLDLPAEMFRSGDTTEEVVLQMYRKQFGLLNRKVKFTTVKKMAMFEGDIALGPADKVREAQEDGARGIGIPGIQFRWPDGILPYVTTDALRSRAKAAMTHWEARTPIRFVKRTTEADYISFQSKDGCWSFVGRQGGKQIISLGGGCGLGAAIHEIGHALGLWHEQSRSDRDDFIKIVEENVVPQHLPNFEKHILDGIDLGAYDYESIMHYPSLAFSANNQPTILTKDGQPIGQRNGLSKGDIESIKILYPDLNWPA